MYTEGGRLMTDAAPFRASRALLISLYCATASYGTLQSIVVPVLPEITRELQATHAEAGWVLTSFLLVGGAVTPVLGRLGDVYGNFRVMAGTLVVFTLGTTISLFSPTIEILIVGRLLQGVGAGTVSIGYALVRNLFPPEQAVAAVGRLAGATAASAAIGLSLAGVVTLYFDFRAIFVLPLIAAVVSLILIVPQLSSEPRRSASENTSVNWLGAVLFFAGTALLLLAITQTGSSNWAGPTTIGIATLCVLLLAGWVVSEHHARHPLLDMRLLFASRVRLINATTMLAGAFAVSAFSLLPIALQTDAPPGLGLSAAMVGLIALPISCLNFAASSLSGEVACRFGTRGMLALGFILSGVALVLVGFFHSQPWNYVLASAIHGFGIGLFFSALPVLTMESVEPGQSGSAAGVFSTLRWVGSAIGTQAIFMLLATSTERDPGSGMVFAYWAVVCFWAGALLLAIVARIRERRE
jgi:MFS family permease